jgi:hypothetical protein
MSTKTHTKSFAEHIEDAPSYTTSRAKEYYQDNNLESFGIAVTPFTQLVCKGVIPKFDKVPDEIKEDVMVACYRAAYRKNSEIHLIKQLSDNLRIRVVDERIARRMLLEHSNYGYNGLSNMPLVPKKLITDELMSEVASQLVNHFKSRQSKRYCALEFFPEDYYTSEIVELAVKASGLNLQHVPDEYKTQEICKEAVTNDGGALKFVPEEHKSVFYVDAAKSGNGLSTIPEEDRTDRLCTMAVQANGMELKYVPADRMSYALAMMAVDSDAEALNFIPVEMIDKEIATIFLMSVYSGKHACRDYQINGEYSDSRDKTPSEYPLGIAINAITRDFDRLTKQREAIEEVIIEAIKRKPEIFCNVVKFNYSKSWYKLEGILNLGICMQAFKSNVDNLRHIPYEFTVRVWKDFTKDM